MTTETNATTPLDLGAPLRRRDGGEFEVWKVDGRWILGRYKDLCGEWRLTQWLCDGSFWDAHPQKESGLDLLPAPRRIKGWVNVYKSEGHPVYNCGTVFEDKKYCEPSVHRIACIYIDVAEGEGL